MLQMFTMQRDVTLLARRRVLPHGELRCIYAPPWSVITADDRRQRPSL